MPVTVGVLHPGMMGSSLAAAARFGGARVLWCSENRSRDTESRAEEDQLEAVKDLTSLLDQSDVVISICPPEVASDLAREVASRGFAGVYLDANAVSPDTARAIGRIVEEGGARYVDGGVVGPPARSPGGAILYLSGEYTAEIEAIFDGTLVETHSLTGPDGKASKCGDASAVKMAFAAWTKGTSALLLAVRALAEAEGVSDGLLHAWSRKSPGLDDRSRGTAALTAPKAWRFEAEMDEIAATFSARGLPSGFHRGAAEIYGRMSEFKDGSANLESVLAALLRATR